MTVVSRLRKDAALRTVPGPKPPGRRGPAPTYGDRRIDLAKRAGQRRGWTTGVFDLYGAPAVKRTYAECLRRSEAWLFEGERVLVDASFRTDSNRRPFLDAAVRWSVPAVLLLCRAEPAVVRPRLERRRDDAADADWTVYLQAAACWEEPGPLTRLVTREIATGGSREEALAQDLNALCELGLWYPGAGGQSEAGAVSC